MSNEVPDGFVDGTDLIDGISAEKDAGQPCPIHKPGPCYGACPNSPEAHVQREIRRLQAEAWDEGFNSDYEGDGWPPNPYRVTASDGSTP